MSEVFGFVARQGRAVLIGTLVAAILAGLFHRGRPAVFIADFVAIGLLFLLVVVGALVYRPAHLDRLAGDQVSTPPDPSWVFACAIFTMCFTPTFVSQQFRGTVPLPWALRLGTVALWLMATGLYWYFGWNRWGITLTPDGLRDRQPFGSLFVPWAALAAHDPAVPSGRRRLDLHFDHPELVEARGRRGGKWWELRTVADPAVLAAAIAEHRTRLTPAAPAAPPAEVAATPQTTGESALD